ncbi:MAG: methyltransferase [Oscillospiraceae bacterium]|nr:methyltransferase [Oscillospiraceae bacterium]
MNRKIPFEKNELKATEMLPGMFNSPEMPLLTTPVTPKENVAALFYDKHPYWTPTRADSGMFVPPLYNNMLGRGGPEGLTDTFGIAWEWVEDAGGSIVRPGAPLMSDVNEWKDKIILPDIDKWDWAAEAEANQFDTRRSMQMTFINGFWFERLISFMDFLPAAMALIDEDQKDAIKSMFEAMTDLAIKLVDKFCEYWPAIDGFNIHDDWGAQKAPFFSQETAYELFVPYLRALNDHIHSKGRYATLHSCGHNFTRVQCFIDARFDGWDPQAMNDTHGLYEQVGDKIVISVMPDKYDPKIASEADQRLYARSFVDRFCKPGKPSMVSYYYAGDMATPAFCEEIYEYSRKKYGGFIG